MATRDAHSARRALQLDEWSVEGVPMVGLSLLVGGFFGGSEGRQPELGA
jgi:hypothetical protein